MKIISIGDLVTDFYYKDNKLVGVCGGMTSHNIIANIAKSGIDTAVYGACGNDETGKIAIQSLKDLGVDTTNIKIIDDINTRAFHVSYNTTNEGIKFVSKKRCPFCNKKKWYDESMIDTKDIINNIDSDDILVFDNLNKSNEEIINNTKNKKMLDLGQYFEFENISNKEIVNKLKDKFVIINLNERVLKYFYEIFSLSDIKDIYELLNPTLLIVTQGKNGSLFVLNDKVINKVLDKPSKEVDPTGAGDAFFSVFISEYVKNNFVINEEYIDNTFVKATKLTKSVVKNFGARTHLIKLHKIKKVNDECTCDAFMLQIRKQVKRCNINVNNLKARSINAINSGASKKLEKIDFSNISNCIFTGTGGSYASACFASKVINDIYHINTSYLFPRNIAYQNNEKVDMVFLLSYSGTTSDLLEATKNINNNKKYIVTKGSIENVVRKTGLSKSNVISYLSSANKTKERGFLSFEGTIAPSCIFLKYYFFHSNLNNVDKFIENIMDYWKNYFEEFFTKNKNILKELFKPNCIINIFSGDYTNSAGIDLESKIIESGIFNCITHEKKNFSHGRFVNYEHLSEKKNIYFKEKNESKYENELLNYLKKDTTLIIESRYNGILCEFDLLVASQYLIYYISNYLNIDVSKPTYSEDAMKIYFYKGSL